MISKKITKKAFKELCSFHAYGYGQRKYNAIYFDWRDHKNTDEIISRGFKYGIASFIGNVNKKELFDIFYSWVIKGKKLPWFIYAKYAKNNSQRFKTPICLNLDSFDYNNF